MNNGSHAVGGSSATHVVNSSEVKEMCEKWRVD